jgi:hypothetical protein
VTAPTVYNFQSGSLTAQATSGATTLQSDQFADLPTISTPDTMYLTLDPAGDAGTPELVLITNHGAASTSVTVTRARQTTLGGGAARQHEIGTAWVAALSATDARAYIEVAEAGTGLTQRPTLNFGDGLLAADDTTQTTVSVAFDASTPAALDDSGATGAAVVPARRDHVHPSTGLVVMSSFDAAGDLLIGTGADTYTRLARGTEDQVLRATAGSVGFGALDDMDSFAAPTLPTYVATTAPAEVEGQVWVDTTEQLLRVYEPGEDRWEILGAFGSKIGGFATATQTVTTGGGADISWDTVSTFPATDFWSGGSPTVIVIPAGYGGIWAITARCDFSAGTLNASYLLLKINNNDQRWSAPLHAFNGGTISVTYPLNATDDVVFEVYHEGGSNRDATARIEFWLVG